MAIRITGTIENAYDVVRLMSHVSDDYTITECKLKIDEDITINIDEDDVLEMEDIIKGISFIITVEFPSASSELEYSDSVKKYATLI